MTVAIEDHVSNSYITMEPLYERLLHQKFNSSTEAIDYCRETCLEYGFNVKSETGANRNIYIFCSHEENNNSRKRLSTTIKNECKWRIVLNENEYSQWVFRKSLNPNGSEHNHNIISTTTIWPQQVLDKIILLARQQNQSTEEIRDSIKLQFPDITWNDRRFYNYLTQERKRIKQKNITNRVQKLIMATTKLCSVVAANEDWSSCVESDLSKMLENYRQMTRLSNQSLNSMVDLELDMIHSEIDKRNRNNNLLLDNNINNNNLKKRKTTMTDQDKNNNIQIMSIPSCTLFIRSQPLRSLSEPSSQNNRPHPLNTVFTLGSSNNTTTIQQRIDYNNYSRNDLIQSPPIPDNNVIIPSSYNNSNSTFQQQQQQQSFTSFQNSNDFNFDQHRSNNFTSTNYYTTGRESSPNNNLQQRIILQEYEQRHLHPTTLPIIRSTGMIQSQQHQQQHHHHHHHQQQNWS